MAYVAPNSVVQFYGDMGLNDNYDDTLYFANTAAKDAYFSGPSWIIASAQALTYTREQRGFIRVELPMSALIGASYMRYKNTSFENKWFYAFIKNVEYVNNNCTQVNFEIDSMMTWMGDFTLNECFIVRCHQTTDTLGGNLLPEPVSVGEYTYNDYNELVIDGNECAIVVAIADADLYDSGVTQGNYYNGVYSGLTLYAFQRYDAAGIAALINTYSASPDSIVAMYLVPTTAINETIPTTGGVRISPTSSGVSVRRTLEALTGNETLKGYTPRNKKLYTYPYNFECIDNGMGDSLTLRFEYAGTFEINVEVDYNIMSPVEVVLRPFAYKGTAVDTLNTEVLTLTGFPVCAWVSDAYKAWFAQNAFPTALSIGSIGLAAAGNVLTGNFFGVARQASSLLEESVNYISNDYKASIAADFAKGNKAGGSNNYSSGHMHFSYGRMSVNNQVAREIDKFFDLYGYAYNQYGTPNMNARPYWTYVKTVGCSVGGNIPADDASIIENIFNKGVRFWKAHVNIGNYSQFDNTPV